MKRYFFKMLLFLIVSTQVSQADYFLVPVENVIDGGLAAFITRAVSEAEEMSAEGIILRVNTPGGRIDSAVDIKDTLLKSKVPTIAFVDKSAISAGALISLACDSLYMSKGASIGAATAVDLQGKKASEKVISYFRAQMRATAEAKGRRSDIAEAMVDEDLDIEGVIEKGMLLTLTYKEALKLDISDGTYESLDEILAVMGSEKSTVIEYHPNWAENIVRWLTHPIISSMLLSLGFIGLLIEIRTAGWGIGGTLALIALVLFFGSHYIVKLAGIEELLIFGVGIVLLTLEVFVIPGFGITGVGGIICILISLYLTLIGNMPQSTDFIRATYTIGGSVLLTILGTLLLLHFFPKTPFYKKLTLAAVESAGEGYVSSDALAGLLNAEGVALSDLRPAGKAVILGKRIDVVTEGGYISKGANIVVSEIHGSRIVVQEK